MKPLCRSAQLALLASVLLPPPTLAQTPPVWQRLLDCTPEPGAGVCLPRVALTTAPDASFFSTLLATIWREI